MTTSKKYILKKVREKEDKKSFLDRCADTNICPECGGNITTEYTGHPWLTGTTCDSCGKKGTIEV